jgi:hypothetical protein
MLKLQQHTINVVSEDEKKRRQIRTKLASHEKEVKKLLTQGAEQFGALRATLYRCGKVLISMQKVVVDEGYPGGFDRYLRDARDFIGIPRTSVMRYIANYQTIDRLELGTPLLTAADSAHIDLSAPRSLAILGTQKASDVRKMAPEQFINLFIRRQPSTRSELPPPVDDTQAWGAKAAGDAFETLDTYKEKEGVTPEKTAEAARVAGEALLARAKSLRTK